MSSLIYVINGPNLNLLGKREPEKYGRATLDDVETLCRDAAKKHGYEIEFRQSKCSMATSACAWRAVER